MRHVTTDLRPTTNRPTIPLRAFIRRPDLRFISKIHERVAYPNGVLPTPIVSEKKDLELLHTGYSPERMQAKGERNLKILEEARRKAEGNVEEAHYLDFYLTSVYKERKRYKEAIAAARRYDAAKDATWISAEYGYRPYSSWLDAAILAVVALNPSGSRSGMPCLSRYAGAGGRTRCQPLERG